MDAPGLRIDVLRQRFGIRRHQLGELPPFQHHVDELAVLLGQFLAGGEIVQQARARFPLPRLGLAAAGQLEVVEQEFAELLGRSEIELVPGEIVDLRFEPRHALPERRRQPRQDVSVDLDSRAFHVRQHAHQRPLQRLVHAGHALRCEAGLQCHPQAQRDVGILAGVFGRLLERHLREGLVGLLRTRRMLEHLRERHARVLENALRQRVHAVLAAPGIQGIGEQHGVVERRERDAVPVQHQAIEFQVLPDLEHRGIFEQRLEHCQGFADRHLLGIGVAEVEAAAARAVRERHVAGLAGRHGHGEADEFRLHRVEAGRLGVEGEVSRSAGRRDPGLEMRQLRHGFVFRPVDRFASPPSTQRQRQPPGPHPARPSPLACCPALHLLPARWRSPGAQPAVAARRPNLPKCAWSASRIPSHAGSRAAHPVRDHERRAPPPALHAARRP